VVFAADHFLEADAVGLAAEGDDEVVGEVPVFDGVPGRGDDEWDVERVPDGDDGVRDEVEAAWTKAHVSQRTNEADVPFEEKVEICNTSKWALDEG
jgi:hypothetical protein